MKLTKLFQEFFQSEKSAGGVLIFCTIISLFLANVLIKEPFVQIWDTNIGSHTLVEWINDGLMAVFFLMIGLELEREIYIGELSKIKDAALPLIAALGGMIVPALIYVALNWGLNTQNGFGIPMATDIAFALGILSLLGNRVPYSLKVFLTALAVIDDIGAILVIAIFYSKGLHLTYLILALAVFVLLLIFNRLKIHSLWLYLPFGVLMWYFMLHSGVHATISGVLLAFAIPFGNGDENSVSYRLQHFLHKPVAFFILPLFAIANTAMEVDFDLNVMMDHSYNLGVFSGLVIGKVLGITLFVFIAIKLGLGSLPNQMLFKNLIGLGFLGGIGFTMSIFITILAFDDPQIVQGVKFTILIASFVAAMIGFVILFFQLKKNPEIENNSNEREIT